jgi:hypothetical protein
MSDFVPRQFVPGFVVLRGLSGAAREALVEKLNAAPPYMALADVANVIVKVLPPGEDEHAQDVMTSLMSLRAQTRRGGRSIEEVVTGVVESEAVQVESEDAERFAQSLANMITSRAITSATDAASLLTEHDRPIRSLRMLTDVRPIFEDDAGEPPKGAVIVNSLQVEHWTRSGGRDVITFGLDEADLADLKVAVDRAISKTATTRRFLESAGVTAYPVGLDEE